MHELLVSFEHDVSRTLEPIRTECDLWWWHLGDNMPTFSDNETAVAYDGFVTMTPTARVGHPGWCSRFIDFMDAQLNVYIAICARDFPASVIGEISDVHSDLLYMSPQEIGNALPAEVPLVCRFYHMAFYSLIFRSSAHSNAVGASVPLLGPEWAPHKLR